MAIPHRYGESLFETYMAYTIGTKKVVPEGSALYNALEKDWLTCLKDLHKHIL
jgi:hypothetical protein